MAIGKTILKRLTELGWERKDLLDRVDGLTPQALSNLIRRDSKRSEWDEKIAAALQMSVMELVYGVARITYETPPANLRVNQQTAQSEPVRQLVELAEKLSQQSQWELLGMAKLLAAQPPNERQKSAP